jgi:hypothetical protein
MRWTRPLTAIGSAGEKLLDRLLCVFGAVAFSQLPEFFQQYLQRLGGHLAEARRQLGLFQEAAAHSGLTLDQLIDRTQAQAGSTGASLASVMTDTVSRVDHLAAAESALRGASLWSRPFVFLGHLDPEIARGTWEAFRPAVPTTLEGLVYAAVGIVAALSLYHAGVKPVARKLAARPAPSARYGFPR